MSISHSHANLLTVIYNLFIYRQIQLYATFLLYDSDVLLGTE
jgi:hypothetical protein